MTFSATGTIWQIDDYQKEIKPLDQGKIKNFIENFESNYSRFRDTSFVSRLAKNSGTYSTPKSAKKILDFYTQLNKLSQGLFTPTIGENLVNAGYDKDYSFKQKAITSSTEWNNINYNSETISSKQKVQLDFGAAGKGYLIDLVSNYLVDLGYKNFCVDAGGDIKLVGSKTLTIGLEHPEDKESIIGTIKLNNSCLCGSSGNRRKWADFHHIIDPKKHESPKNILATWVTAESCMVADGLATALFLVSPEKLKSEFKFEYLILNSDYTIDKSPEFKAELFI